MDLPAVHSLSIWWPTLSIGSRMKRMGGLGRESAGLTIKIPLNGKNVNFVVGN